MSHQPILEHIGQVPSQILIQKNISLADKNWFQTGGCAQWYCEPKNATEFTQALDFAKTNSLHSFVLGQGANILVSDDGFDGLVIRPKILDISTTKDDHVAFVTAGAGVTMHDLILYCLDQNLLGLEEFSGIPGTVGGSVYINLHYYEFLLEQFLVSAQVVHKDSGEVLTVDTSWFKFGYDQSRLQEKEYYLVSATFTLKSATDLEIARARGRREEIIRHRQRRYPAEFTCGSFFRNFLPEEVVNTKKKLIYVAYYLDKIGVKGELSVGGALVSHQHANMIVNKNKATSTDIIQLAQLMQNMVYEKFGIKPQPECQLIGFQDNIL